MLNFKNDEGHYRNVANSLVLYSTCITAGTTLTRGRDEQRRRRACCVLCYWHRFWVYGRFVVRVRLLLKCVKELGVPSKSSFTRLFVNDSMPPSWMLFTVESVVLWKWCGSVNTDNFTNREEIQRILSAWCLCVFYLRGAVRRMYLYVMNSESLGWSSSAEAFLPTALGNS